MYHGSDNSDNSDNSNSGDNYEEVQPPQSWLSRVSGGRFGKERVHRWDSFETKKTWTQTLTLGLLGKSADEWDDSDEEKSWTQTLTLNLAGGPASEKEREKYQTIWGDPQDDINKRIRLEKLLKAYLGIPYLNQLSFRHHLPAVQKIYNDLQQNQNYTFDQAFFDLLKIYYSPECRENGSLGAMVSVLSNEHNRTLRTNVREEIARERALALIKSYNQGFLHPNRHFSQEVNVLISSIESDPQINPRTILEKLDDILRNTGNANGRLAKIRENIVYIFVEECIYDSESVPTLQFNIK